MGTAGEAGPWWPPVPPLWPGGTAVICASGPSLERRDVARVRDWRARAWRGRGAGRHIAVVNSTWRLCPDACLLYAADGRWWISPDGAAARREFAGLKVTQDAVAAKAGVLRVPGEFTAGMSFDPPRIHFGGTDDKGGHAGNSGFQAVNLAVLLGARRIILLGFDMGFGAAGEVHHHGPHRWKGPAGQALANPNETMFKIWRKGFALAAPGLAAAGIEVINCSRATSLDCFPRAALEDVL